MDERGVDCSRIGARWQADNAGMGAAKGVPLSRQSSCHTALGRARASSTDPDRLRLPAGCALPVAAGPFPRK